MEGGIEVDFFINLTGTITAGYSKDSLAAIANAAFMSLGEFAEYLDNDHNEGRHSLNFNITVQPVDIVDEGYSIKATCNYWD